METVFKGFFENLKSRPDQKAFTYLKRGRFISHTYSELYCDIKKAAAYLKNNGFNETDNVLLLLKPSYDFYVFLLAGFFVGYKTVIIDIFTGSERLKRKLELSAVNKLLTNRKFNLLRKFISPLRKIKTTLINGFASCESFFGNVNLDRNNEALITFTSGGSGKAKAVIRTLGDLDDQMSLLQMNLRGIGAGDGVIMTLPVYPLAGLALGAENVLFFESPKNRRYAQHFLKAAEISKAVIGSVIRYLPLSGTYGIQKVFTGGSIIFPKDAARLRNIFPASDITYIYGSTEAALISVTNFDEYMEGLKNDVFCMGHPAEGVDVIINGDEILLGGKYIMHNYLRGGDNSDIAVYDGADYIRTGDFGRIENGKLYIKGRKNLSDTANGIFNYEVELTILRKYNLPSRPAFISVTETPFLFLEKNCIKSAADIAADNPYLTVELINKIPLDDRHHYKTDYEKLKTIAEHRLRK